MKNIVIALLFANSNAYGVNRCRSFTDDQLVKDFDVDDFSGQWFPLYESRFTRYPKGLCPVTYLGRLQPSHPAQASRINALSSSEDLIEWFYSYKAQQGIVDNIRKYRGYFDKGESNGSLWTGATLKPMKRFKNNL